MERKISIDINKAKAGDRVRFANPQAGYDNDQKRAKTAGLVVGEVYTLTKVEIHDWHTDVWLKEVEAVPFNSVQFSEV